MRINFVQKIIDRMRGRKTSVCGVEKNSLMEEVCCFNAFHYLDCIKVLRGKETPLRILQDHHAPVALREITGAVLEVGAASYSHYSDLCVNASEYIKTNISPDSPGILEADITKMTAFGDNSVDAVICFNVLEHVYDFDSAFKEAYRILKPNG